jgi:hypothetical protein
MDLDSKIQINCPLQDKPSLLQGHFYNTKELALLEGVFPWKSKIFGVKIKTWDYFSWYIVIHGVKLTDVIQFVW